MNSTDPISEHYWEIARHLEASNGRSVIAIQLAHRDEQRPLPLVHVRNWLLGQLAHELHSRDFGEGMGQECAFVYVVAYTVNLPAALELIREKLREWGLIGVVRIFYTDMGAKCAKLFPTTEVPPVSEPNQA